MDYLIAPEVPRIDETELRRFVLGVADRQVFTSAHMTLAEFEQIGMVVFIPLIGGPFHPEPGVHVPPEPELPPSPPEPKLIENPEKPKPTGEPEVKEPKLAEPDPKYVAELELRVCYQVE